MRRTPIRVAGRIRVRLDFERHGGACGRSRTVWFEYTPGNPVLRDVTFTIEPGQKVAILGATGAGKSTLLSLLCRFYDPTRGRDPAGWA